MSDFHHEPDAKCGSKLHYQGLARRPGCGALIRWVVLSGKPHPIDPDPSPKGTLGIVEPETIDPGSNEDQSAVVVALSKVRRESWEGNLYVSHFATCALAANFRSKK